VSKNKVIVFVKNTISGKVKTRLAKTIGKDEALRVYLRLLAITKEEVSKVRAEKEVWYAWEVSENDIWDENYFKKKVQIEGDLGEKMKDAFKKSFDSGGEKIVLIGSDCPTLTNEVLEQAFNELNTSDVVFSFLPKILSKFFLYKSLVGLDLPSYCLSFVFCVIFVSDLTFSMTMIKNQSVLF